MRLLKTKQFYIILSIVLFFGIIGISVYWHMCIQTRDEMSQLLVDNNVGLEEVYDDSDKIAEFTKSKNAINNEAKKQEAQKQEEKIKDKSASESNLLAVVNKFCSAMYSYDSNTNQTNRVNQVKSCVTDDVYNNYCKKEIDESVRNLEEGYQKNYKINKVYFRNFNTEAPKGYIEIVVRYKYKNAGSGAYDLLGNIEFTRDKSSDTWMLSLCNLKRE